MTNKADKAEPPLLVGSAAGVTHDPQAVTLAAIPSEAAGSATRLSPEGSSEAVLEATAVMPAAGSVCPACKQPNHLGVSTCVFCNAVIEPGAPAAATSGYSERSAPTSDPPPSSRAQFMAHDSELPGLPVGDPLIGVVVAERYKIVEALGRGGMGAVYKVEHVRIGKLLAMKLLTGELSRNPDVVRRFKLEALTVSKLSSPSTVQVFDFGAAEGLTYLVMELVAGEDLGRTLRSQGPMPWSRVARIIIQVCSSLAEAHQKGIVHRDIKPENVMLVRARDGSDLAKVLDFGLAKLREGEGLNDVTSQGAIVGTPYFMAPEQIKGEAVDARTDIYALGAMMYRALTGHYPFNGTTPMAVFTKHLTELPTSPIDRAPDLEIPVGINRLVLKALSKNAEARFQKVEDVQARLVEELKSVGISSAENLLDSSELRRLARASAGDTAAPPAPGVPALPKAEIATRDEVFAYERTLRRQRYGALVGLGATLLVAVAGGAKLLQLNLARAREFTGVEVEPNDSAREATPVPLGQEVTAQLGRRVDPTHGDRDFFAFDLPASPSSGGTSALIRLEVSSLPNLAMCTLIYKQGFSTALAQYCIGRAGRDLVIPALRLDPGRYLITELQDLDPYGGPPPFIHENVSDSYRLLAASVEPDRGHEIEPNDQVASAEQLSPGSALTASIGWSHDEDVFCIPEQTPGKIRWKVRDGLRDVGLLQATPIRGGEEGAPVRIHRGSSGKTSPTDVLNPWISPVIAGANDAPRCIRIGLGKDPWAGERASAMPSGGSEAYVVEVEAVP